MIRFYGQMGTYILSAGLDSTLRAFSIYSERLNRSLGTASFSRKQAKKKGVRRETALGNVLAPVTQFDYVTTREKDWDNIVAIHRETLFVTTWSFDRKRMGEHKLLPERFLSAGGGNKIDPKLVTATAVSLSTCGHFALVGFSSGHIDRFNLQSGMHRGSYIMPNGDTAHDGVVRALACGQLNHVIISGGADRRLAFWRFSKGNQLGALSLTSSVALLRMHVEANLLAVALDDFRVLVVDVETKRVVRRLGPHGGRITDMTLDEECRRLYVGSMDSLVYVWDLMSGLLVDRFRVASPVVSLSISPSSEFLATTHVDDLGIYLWSNLSTYSTVALRPLEITEVENVPKLALPTIKSDEEEGEEEEDKTEEEEKQETAKENDLSIDAVYKSPEQIATHLVTFSGQAVLRWRDLVNLDLTRKRNKPLEPVQKPKAAPFFLPTVSGLQGPKFSLKEKSNDAEDDQEDEKTKSAKRKLQATFFPSDLGTLLEQTASNENKETVSYRSVVEQMIEWGPAQLDAQIRMLDSTGGFGDRTYLAFFLELIEQLVTNGLYYELANGWLSLFLKVHIETIASDELLRTKLAKIGEAINSSWTPLCRTMDECLSIIKFLRNALITS